MRALYASACSFALPRPRRPAPRSRRADPGRARPGRGPPPGCGRGARRASKGHRSRRRSGERRPRSCRRTCRSRPGAAASAAWARSRRVTCLGEVAARDLDLLGQDRGALAPAVEQPGQLCLTGSGDGCVLASRSQGDDLVLDLCTESLSVRARGRELRVETLDGLPVGAGNRHRQGHASGEDQDGASGQPRPAPCSGRWPGRAVGAFSDHKSRTPGRAGRAIRTRTGERAMLADR